MHDVRMHAGNINCRFQKVYQFSENDFAKDILRVDIIYQILLFLMLSVFVIHVCFKKRIKLQKSDYINVLIIPLIVIKKKIETSLIYRNHFYSFKISRKVSPTYSIPVREAAGPDQIWRCSIFVAVLIRRLILCLERQSHVCQEIRTHVHPLIRPISIRTFNLKI